MIPHKVLTQLNKKTKLKFQKHFYDRQIKKEPKHPIPNMTPHTPPT